LLELRQFERDQLLSGAQSVKKSDDASAVYCAGMPIHEKQDWHAFRLARRTNRARHYYVLACPLSLTILPIPDCAESRSC